jgi:hypothetical protein
MIVEMYKGDFVWLKEFLDNYLCMVKSHVLNGEKISDKRKENLINIVETAREKSGVFLVNIDRNDTTFLIDLLDFNTCACPGCSLAGVKHRKNIANMLMRLIHYEEEL